MNEDDPSPPLPPRAKYSTEKEQRKEHLFKKLSRLIPCNCGNIQVLQVDEALITEQDQVDKQLAEYWERIFLSSAIGEEWHSLFQQWIREIGESLPLPPDCPEWNEDAMDIATKSAGSSAPGPDGIPYEAYKRHQTKTFPKTWT
jgi:hypothetical protein